MTRAQALAFLGRDRAFLTPDDMCGLSHVAPLAIQQLFGVDRYNDMLFLPSMTLIEYLSEKGRDRYWAAAELNVSPEAVRLWLAGHRTPTPEMMRRIMEWSGGKVSPNDFVLTPAGSTPPAPQPEAAE
jgi:hypothetical protein